jgi:uncharacterized membrane protein YkvA (DUF1232 family)
MAVDDAHVPILGAYRPGRAQSQRPAYGWNVTAPQPPPASAHPIARLAGPIGRLPRYLSLARRLLGEPRLARWRKGVLGGGLVYLAMPLDLVPGVIPVAGQLDDLAALLLGLRVALRGCSPATAEGHLREAGLSEADLDRDLAIVRAAAAWIGRRVARSSIRLGRASLRIAGRVARFGIDRGGRLLGAARRGR